MPVKPLSMSELVTNPDGSIYHLNLLPGDIADTIILVGDPGRVEAVSHFFDKIEVVKENREFITHTGYYGGTRISVISTGIGTGNIDIVINELDALANIDISRRRTRQEHRKLNLIRVGTSGSLQEDIPAGSFVISEIALGIDGLLNFYNGRNEVCDKEFEKAFCESVNWRAALGSPYVVSASPILLQKLGDTEMITGATISAPGFYAPQGRELRLPAADHGMNGRIERFRYGKYRICNYEMECSAIYGLSRLLGHEAVTVCAVIANRKLNTFIADYENVIIKLIEIVLKRIANRDYEKKGHTGAHTSA